MADGEVHVLAGEIHVMESCRDTQIDVWMLFGKATKAVDQPFGGKIRRRAHSEHAGTLTLEQSFGATAMRSKASPCLGDDQTLALAIKELDPELQFHGLHLVVHASLGHAQLLRSA